jgi:hypothetical protein
MRCTGSHEADALRVTPNDFVSANRDCSKSSSQPARRAIRKQDRLDMGIRANH